MDEVLARTTSTANGSFELEGGVSSVFAMAVRLRLSHDCDRSLPCQRRVDLRVPDRYVSRQESVERWLQVGVLNMELRVRRVSMLSTGFSSRRRSRVASADRGDGHQKPESSRLCSRSHDGRRQAEDMPLHA